MCTAISVNAGKHYFGRNLDYERTFGEMITITPRNYKFSFKNGRRASSHYAIIGIALPLGGYPLYFDGVNEAGLCIAGLNFPHFAEYKDKVEGKENVASFELIPYILSECKSVSEAEKRLKNINITNEQYCDNLKPTPLHWIISDKNKTITAEQISKGLCVYDNPVGVLTNAPSFDMQIFNLNNYMMLSNCEPTNNFSKQVKLTACSRGMGAIGLPGDLSSASRFVRASFIKLNSIFGATEEEIVSQFFHVLYSVYQQRGCVKVGNLYEITNYTSCCNASKGIYYYTTYNAGRICAVDMHREDLSGKELITYELMKKQDVFLQN